ncbi:MAG: L,D-transpeptidase family protein [Pseudomonadota bacterium]
MLPWRGRFEGSPRRGVARFGSKTLQCAIGRSGMSAWKREGDGASPIGRFKLVNVYFRKDRRTRPVTALPARAIRKSDGWCDAPMDTNYNRFVSHPYRASAERLWRTDELYDLILVTSHNQRPRVRWRGSAVFVHVARGDFEPTEGCVALKPADLNWLLRKAGPRCYLTIVT